MRKRSKYRPKGQFPDPVTWVLAGIKQFKDVPKSIDIRIKNHAAMDALRKGEAGKSEVDILIGAFNMAEAYMKLRPDLGADWADEIKSGQDALLAVAKRGVETGRFVLKATELTAMNLVMELHDVQLDNTTVRDMELAMEIVEKEYKHRRMRAVQEVTHGKNSDGAGTQRAVASPASAEGHRATEAKASTRAKAGAKAEANS